MEGSVQLRVLGQDREEELEANCVGWKEEIGRARWEGYKGGGVRHSVDTIQSFYVHTL